MQHIDGSTRFLSKWYRLSDMSVADLRDGVAGYFYGVY